MIRGHFSKIRRITTYGEGYFLLTDHLKAKTYLQKALEMNPFLQGFYFRINFMEM
jgi:hypothetical protein